MAVGHLDILEHALVGRAALSAGGNVATGTTNAAAALWHTNAAAALLRQLQQVEGSTMARLAEDIQSTPPSNRYLTRPLQHLMVLFNRGLLAERAGRLEEAVSAYRASAQLAMAPCARELGGGTLPVHTIYLCVTNK